MAMTVIWPSSQSLGSLSSTMFYVGFILSTNLVLIAIADSGYVGLDHCLLLEKVCVLQTK